MWLSAWLLTALVPLSLGQGGDSGATDFFRNIFNALGVGEKAAEPKLNSVPCSIQKSNLGACYANRTLQAEFRKQKGEGLIRMSKCMETAKCDSNPLKGLPNFVSCMTREIRNRMIIPIRRCVVRGDEDEDREPVPVNAAILRLLASRKMKERSSKLQTSMRAQYLRLVNGACPTDIRNPLTSPSVQAGSCLGAAGLSLATLRDPCDDPVDVIQERCVDGSKDRLRQHREEVCDCLDIHANPSKMTALGRRIISCAEKSGLGSLVDKTKPRSDVKELQEKIDAFCAGDSDDPGIF